MDTSAFDWRYKVLLEKLRSLPAFVLGLIGFVIVVSASGVATLTVTTTDTLVDFSAENFILDPDTAVENSNITKAASTQAANGNLISSPVDATTGLATVNTALTQDDFVYRFEVKEQLVDSWSSTRAYAIEAFGDGVPIGTLYVDNGTDNATAVEGTTVLISLGSGIPDSITIKVQRTAE